MKRGDVNSWQASLPAWGTTTLYALSSRDRRRQIASHGRCPANWFKHSAVLMICSEILTVKDPELAAIAAEQTDNAAAAVRHLIAIGTIGYFAAGMLM
jgi:hypothetical protein